MPKTWICGSRTKHGKRSELQVDLRAAGRKRLHQRSNGDSMADLLIIAGEASACGPFKMKIFGFFPNSATFALCCNLSNYIYIHAISYIIQFYIYIYSIHMFYHTHTCTHAYIYICWFVIAVSLLIARSLLLPLL